MKWLKHTRFAGTKAGSYLVEASIIVPVFIISVLMLISIVPIIAVCENVVFIAADEMGFETVKSGIRENPVALPAVIRHRMVTENPKMTSYENRFYRYMYKDTAAAIDDLISLDFRAAVSENNPLGLFSRVVFDGNVTARAFSGKIFTEPPVPAGAGDEEDETVYIFPEWGTKYHSKNCTYIKAACQQVYLSDDVIHRFKPCKLCHAESVLKGSPVFLFWSSGQVYHVSGCRIVERYYIETKKQLCEAKGYTPCSKCGGN